MRKLFVTLFISTILTSFFNLQAFALQDQGTINNPKIVVAPMSTDDWQEYLVKLLPPNLSETERFKLFEKVAIITLKLAGTVSSNAKEGDSLENIFRYNLAAYSMGWYVCEESPGRQSKNIKDLKQLLQRARPMLQAVIGDEVINKSCANLSEAMNAPTKPIQALEQIR